MFRHAIQQGNYIADTQPLVFGSGIKKLFTRYK